MEGARSILQKLLVEKDNLKLSVHKTKRVQCIELIRARQEDGRHLLFSSRPFLLCGLPLKRPPTSTLIHKRQNGKFLLEVCGHPEYGLPFGQDRLVPIWVASQAVLQRRRQIRFESGAQILEEFGLPTDGIHYKRLLDGFKRIFASTIYFGTADLRQSSRVWDFARFSFFDRLTLWNATTPAHEDRSQIDRANEITLSETFWQEIQNHPIPIDRDVVRCLANAPGALDFYMWLSWRSHHARGRQFISLLGPTGLVHQLGSATYLRPRDFRRTVQRWLDLISLYWPACPARLSSDGTTLLFTNPPKSTIRQQA